MVDCNARICVPFVDAWVVEAIGCIIIMPHSLSVILAENSSRRFDSILSTK